MLYILFFTGALFAGTYLGYPLDTHYMTRNNLRNLNPSDGDQEMHAGRTSGPLSSTGTHFAVCRLQGKQLSKLDASQELGKMPKKYDCRTLPQHFKGGKHKRQS